MTAHRPCTAAWARCTSPTNGSPRTTTQTSRVSPATSATPSSRRPAPLLALRLRPRRDERLYTRLDVPFGMRGGQLHPDAGLVLRYDRVGERDDVDALVQHRL